MKKLHYLNLIAFIFCVLVLFKLSATKDTLAFAVLSLLAGANLYVFFKRKSE